MWTGFFADMLNRMYSKDRERCKKFDTCAKMEKYFNRGGKYLEDEMLIKGNEGQLPLVFPACDPVRLCGIWGYRSRSRYP